MYKTFKVSLGLFSYGFVRGIRSETDGTEPTIPFGTKLLLSIGNGINYVAPPFCLFKVIDLVDRTDIYLTGKDPERYKDCYTECFYKTKNKNIWW